MRSVKLLGLLLLLSLLTDVATYLMGSMHQNTTYLSNLYTPLEFILWCLLYLELLPRYKKMINFSMGLFLVFFLTDSLLLESLSEFQSHTLTLEALILLVFSVIFFIYFLKRLNAPSTKVDFEDSEHILYSSNYANFWFNSAVFFYFAMNIYLFSISRFIFTHESADTAMMFWGLHNFCNTVKNLLIAVGIYYAGEKEETLVI